MRGRFAPYMLGAGLVGLAGLMAVFAVYALIAREPANGFLVTAVVSALIGFPLTWVGRSQAEPSRREALTGVMLLWAAIPAASALTYAVTLGVSYVDALFESMSGFTTTGATIVRDFAAVPDSLFLWRALSQWIGGVGIIVLFIAVFPQLAIAGRQLFFAEAPGPTEERLTPRLRTTASAVAAVYLGLTILCALGYMLAGMSAFDAVAHSFTTLAAGGFSPEARSLEAYAPAVQWVSILFMFFAGANFSLQYRALSGRPRELFRDAEFRAYGAIVVVAGVLLSLSLFARYGNLDAVRHGFFQVLSILTTTGYASTDFAQWGDRSNAILLVLMFIGGSAGSGAGGIKVVRWLIVLRHAAREVRHALHPRAVLPLRVGQRIVSEPVFRAVAAFITLYVGLFAVTTAIVTAFGADFITAFTASIACIGNIGPGLASVGPMANFADLHPVSRVALTFAMYAGRLEIVTVFVIFTRGWWRLPRKNIFRGPGGPGADA